MDDSKRRQLLELKQKLLNDIVPMVETSDFNPVQKFELLLSAARISDNPERYQAAYATIASMQEADIKLNAMLELMDAIDDATIVSPNESIEVDDEQPQEVAPEQQ